MIRRALHGVAALALVALISFSAFAWSRRVDERASARYGQQLRSLLALDVRLSAEVMKARAGLVGHYDGIVQTLAARKRLHGVLQQLPRGLWPEGGDDVRERLRNGEQKRLHSERLVERFKREHAVLRNSLRFLPVLADELEKLSGPAAASKSHNALGELIRDELLLQSWQDGALTARIDRDLGILDQASGPGAAAETAGLATLLAHARVVRERTPLVQELTREIVAAGDAGWTEAMLSTFLQRHSAAQRVADFDASVRFMLAIAFLAAGAASIILRQRESAMVLRSASEQLTQALAAQQELSELKSRFVSMASHEFRTPLSVIASSSELLETYAERWSSTKKQEHFGRIRQAAAGMTRMLDAILTIGRHNAGLLRFEPKALEVDSFCAQVVEAVGAATGQGRRIAHHSLLAVHERALADPVLLRHVLENLLSNALKYSSEGTVVELGVRREEEMLCFDVCDQGIGISEDDQRRLFETFQRGKNVGEISGTGLGLAIVRAAVELHGGSVAVHSELSVGTRFTVRIPCVGTDV